MIVQERKKCIDCGIEKDKEDFYTRPNGSFFGYCKICHQTRNNIWRKNNPEKTKECKDKWRKEHLEEHKEYTDKYRKKYPDRYKETNRRWAKKHPEKMKESRNKLRSTPKGNLSHRMTTALGRSLRRGKAGRSWESIVGFTADQLKIHLEKRFKDGMSWENYGEWHIDHKIPVSAFNFEKSEDIDFKRCWTLKNLQPLWRHANLQKHKKLEKPFQPSLIM